MHVNVNGVSINLAHYGTFHDQRFNKTLRLVRALGGGRVAEVGGHPWAMTARLLLEPGVEVAATVSAEEVTHWPDAIPVEKKRYEFNFQNGQRAQITNYSANIERTMFELEKKVDIALACEIIEHLTRAPHVMLLNINSWLEIGGRVIITTPNGAQLENPFRVKAKMPALRCSIYARHNYVFTMDALKDLVTACGFEVELSEYWAPYARRGGSQVYRAIMKAPSTYLKDKFSQTLVVVGRKIEDRDTASRLPVSYERSSSWERVDQDNDDYVDSNTNFEG